MLKGLIRNAKETMHELSEMERLFAADKSVRELVFYGERDIQWHYYVDFIEHILANSDKQICYLTSDMNDPIFQTKESRIKPFFIKNAIAAAFAKLDAKVLVMTNPDLGTGIVKRAPEPVHHAYIFHSVSSIHQSYRLGAFDNYDSILCIGDYQIEELRKTEEIYGLKKRHLPLVGYPLVERINRDHQKYLVDNEAKRAKKPICLVAPTWDFNQKSSIMDCCINDMLEPLAKTGFEIWLRPHPEFLKRFSNQVDALRKRISKYPNISIRDNVGSMECLNQADVMITDHSAISMEYVLGTERPLLFIDTPTRVDNPEVGRLGIEPIENVLRSEMGKRIQLTELNSITSALESLIAERDEFKNRVPALRDKLVANWQKSAAVGGDYLLSLL